MPLILWHAPHFNMPEIGMDLTIDEKPSMQSFKKYDKFDMEMSQLQYAKKNHLNLMYQCKIFFESIHTSKC